MPWKAATPILTCAAAPIADPAGQLLGVIDISGDHRGYHRHTLGLGRSAACMIEHQLFEARTMARENPQAVANILRSWIDSPAT